MATVYRDYGKLSDMDFPQNTFDIESRRLVYLATHRGDGTRLPLMNRSFISFTYGGKAIEDFDLIATIVNDRLTKEGYASFEDIITTYDNLDGLFYWNTHYKNNSLTFILSTDGIELRTLDDFLHWFHAGEAKELILAEHPNRAIMARVALPPELSLLPFEHDATIIINKESYKTKTTLYKGDITLLLIMDEPHWYAILNVLGVLLKDELASNNSEHKDYYRYVDYYTDVNGNYMSLFQSLDALKILYEDGIPLGSMIDTNLLLGNGTYANVSKDAATCVWDPEHSLDEIVWTNGIPSGLGARINGIIYEEDTLITDNSVTASEALNNPIYNVVTTTDANDNPIVEIYRIGSKKASRITINTEDYDILESESDELLILDKEPGFLLDAREYPAGLYRGIIAGAIVDASGNGIVSMTNNLVGHFFYSGTAPAPTIITFTLNLSYFDSSSLLEKECIDNYGYISVPENTYTNKNKPYSTITITSRTSLELRFTTPNILTSYNKVISIFDKCLGKSWEDTLDEIRNNVRHAVVRSWAAYLLTYHQLANSSSALVNIDISSLKLQMSMLFRDNEGKLMPMTFSFNSKTGEAFGYFKYRTTASPLVLIDDSIEKGIYYTSSVVSNNMQEDVGDMLYSNYIIIKDRNYPNADGKIGAWDARTEDGKAQSHKITHDLPTTLTNLLIYYRNMYL